MIVKDDFLTSHGVSPPPFPSAPLSSARSFFGQSRAGPSSQSQESSNPRRRSEDVHHHLPSLELPLQPLVEEPTLQPPRPPLDRQQHLDIPSPSLSDPAKGPGEQPPSAVKGSRAGRPHDSFNTIGSNDGLTVYRQKGHLLPKG